jgi:hypothetical protein
MRRMRSRYEWCLLEKQPDGQRDETLAIEIERRGGTNWEKVSCYETDALEVGRMRSKNKSW